MDKKKKLRFEQVDFHVHSIWSRGRGGVAEASILLDDIISDAEERGIYCLGLTEHWDSDTRAFKFIEEKKSLLEKIRESNTDIKIYFSAEVNIYNDNGDNPIEPVKHSEILKVMEYLSGSPHLTALGKSMIPYTKNIRVIIDYIQRAHMSIIKNDLFSFICHPYSTFNILRQRGFVQSAGEAFSKIPDKYLKEFAEAAAFYNKGVEIANVPLAANKNGDPRHKGFRQAYKVFVKELIKAGAKMSVGSDSHNRNDGWSWVGKNQEAVSLIKECGGDKTLLWLPEER